MKRITFLAFFLLGFFISAHAKTIHVVAAENMYGDIAQTIGGNTVQVQSILSQPNSDPHLFNPDPKTIQQLQQADIVIINGAGYDAWIDPLLHNTQAHILDVSKINRVTTGANPHLWYNLSYTKNFANALVDTLDSLNKNDVAMAARAKEFNKEIMRIQAQMEKIKSQDAGAPVTATEPIAGYLLEPLGLKILDQHFQLSMMNDTEPSSQDYAQMLKHLRDHQVRLLIFNEQVTDPMALMIRTEAIKAKIPVVGMTELLPLDQHYLGWYEGNVKKVGEALKKE